MEAIKNLQALIDTAVKAGGIFSEARAVLIMQNSLDTLAKLAQGNQLSVVEKPAAAVKSIGEQLADRVDAAEGTTN